jgi:hypothetical protein
MILRILNTILWAMIVLAVAIQTQSFDDPPRLFGQATISFALWFGIDVVLRRRASRKEQIQQAADE